jgi:hypothetical protein
MSFYHGRPSVPDYVVMPHILIDANVVIIADANFPYNKSKL